MKKHQYTGFWILVGLIFLALFISTLFKDKNQPIPKDLKFSEFITKVESHEITSVDIGGNIAYGHTTLQQPAVPALPPTTLPGTQPSTPSTTGTAVIPAPGGKVASFPVEYRVVLPEGGSAVDLLVPVLQKNNVPFTFREPKAHPVCIHFHAVPQCAGWWLSGAFLRQEPRQDVYG
jgi:hypothetical protein